MLVEAGPVGTLTESHYQEIPLISEELSFLTLTSGDLKGSLHELVKKIPPRQKREKILTYHIQLFISTTWLKQFWGTEPYGSPYLEIRDTHCREQFESANKGLPLPLGRGVCETKSKNGHPRPRKPFISRIFCAQRGIETMVSDHDLGSGRRKRGVEFKGGSRHDRNRQNCQNRQNRHGCVFVLYFVGDSVEGKVLSTESPEPPKPSKPPKPS